MDFNSLSPLQKEIFKALESHCEKALITEAFLTKSIRSNLKLEGKNKAGLALNDIEAALEAFNAIAKGRYSLHTNSAHDLLLKKDSIIRALDSEARKRRQSSEKSMTILTNSDLTAKKTIKNKAKKRTETKKINIYSDFEEMEAN